MNMGAPRMVDKHQDTHDDIATRIAASLSVASKILSGSVGRLVYHKAIWASTSQVGACHLGAVSCTCVSTPYGGAANY